MAPVEHAARAGRRLAWPARAHVEARIWPRRDQDLCPRAPAGAHWEDAERCFQQMLAQGCTPDGITYSALITAFERGGQWRRALSAYAQMTAQVGTTAAWSIVLGCVATCPQAACARLNA